MSARAREATRRRAAGAGVMLVVVALLAADGRSIARAQGGRAANQRPNQGTGLGNSLNPYAAPPMRGHYAPYLMTDPTADERADVAGRVDRAILDEGTPTRPGAGLELVERLGPWSLRWQEAQDNAAKSRAARYRSLSDHLARMSDLERGLSGRGPGRATAAEAARFFRPIDGWDLDRIVPGRFDIGLPINPVGVAVTPAEQAGIASRVYGAILDDAIRRYLAAARAGGPRPREEPTLDATMAERLGSWSDLWSRAQDAADRDVSGRLAAARGGRSEGGRTAAIRAHAERMAELEDGRFADEALKRAGRPAVGPADMARSREFAEAARFFRIEAEGRLPGGSSVREAGADPGDSGQAATAGRIYRAILDGAARRYRDTPRAGEGPADAGLVFDSRLAERLAAWSARWARARIRADGSRASQFTAVRSHLERMAALEEGRSLRDALERAGEAAALAPPRAFADVARFFRLEALWELEQIKAR